MDRIYIPILFRFFELLPLAANQIGTYLCLCSFGQCRAVYSTLRD